MVLNSHQPKSFSRFTAFTLVLFSILCMVSCTDSNDHWAAVAEANQRTLSELAKEYNALIGWEDSATEMNFSIQLESLLCKKPIAFISTIDDIVRHNDTIFVMLTMDSYNSPTLGFILDIDSTLVDRVLNSSPPDSGTAFFGRVTLQSCVAVASIATIERPRFGAVAYLNGVSDDYETYMYLEPPETFILRGTCIDLVF